MHTDFRCFGIFGGMLMAAAGCIAKDAPGPSVVDIEAMARQGQVLEAQQQLIDISRTRGLKPEEADLLSDLAVSTELAQRRQQLADVLKIWKPTGKVPEGLHPWIVAIQFFDRAESSWITLCGGSVIGPRMVLTAGHCTVFPRKNVRIAYGSVNLMSPGVRYAKVVDQKVADGYGEVTLSVKIPGQPTQKGTGAQNDYGILIADADLNIAPAKTSLELGVPGSMPDVQSLRVFGWGQSDTSLNPSELAFGEVTLMSQQECSKYYSPLHASMMCAGNNAAGTNFCSGDSGGPVIVRGGAHPDAIVGLVSFTAVCAVPVGVYADLEAGRDWISKMRKQALQVK